MSEYGYTENSYTLEEMTYLANCWNANKSIPSTIAVFLDKYPCSHNKLVWVILLKLEKIMNGEPYWPTKEELDSQQVVQVYKSWTSTNPPPQKP